METKSGEFYILAVKDELTGKFMQPQFFATKEEGERVFQYQINNIDIWKYNASDYSLYKLGLFSQESGMILPDIEKIVSGNTVKKED